MMSELESVPLGQRHSSQRLRRPAARCRRSGGGLRMRPGFVTGGIGTNRLPSSLAEDIAQEEAPTLSHGLGALCK